MKIILITLLAASGMASGNLLAADIAAGKEKASSLCAACHGADGNTPLAPDYPKLAGQPADYLAKALRDYQTGARKNPLMSPQAQSLSKKDIKNVAAYYSSLGGDLKVKY
ncbi:MAG: c-type cytochrome [Burkholderiales bacterium]